LSYDTPSPSHVAAYTTLISDRHVPVRILGTRLFFHYVSTCSPQTHTCPCSFHISLSKSSSFICDITGLTCARDDEIHLLHSEHVTTITLLKIKFTNMYGSTKDLPTRRHALIRRKHRNIKFTNMYGVTTHLDTNQDRLAPNLRHTYAK
jgi:hypothetical protein